MQESKEKVFRTSDVVSEVIELEEPTAQRGWEEASVIVLRGADESSQEQVLEDGKRFEVIDDVLDLLPESDRFVDTSKVVSGLPVKFSDGTPVEMPRVVSEVSHELDIPTHVERDLAETLTVKTEETDIEAVTEVSDKEPSTEEVVSAVDLQIKEGTDVLEIKEPTETLIPKQTVKETWEDEIPAREAEKETRSGLSGDEVITLTSTESERDVVAEITSDTQIPTIEYSRDTLQEAGERVLRPSEMITEEVESEVSMESKAVKDEITVKPKLELVQEAGDKMLRRNDVVPDVIEYEETTRRKLEEDVRIDAQPITEERIAEDVLEAGVKVLGPKGMTTNELEVDILSENQIDESRVDTYFTDIEPSSEKMQESEEKLYGTKVVASEVIEFEEPVPESASISAIGVVSIKPVKEDRSGVRIERTEGEVRNIEDTKEGETIKEDGTRVKRTTKTITHLQSVTDVTWKHGVKAGETEREELVGKDIYEEITEIAPGIDLLFADNVRIETSVTDSEKTLTDGTWEKRTTTWKIVRPSLFAVEPLVDEKKLIHKDLLRVEDQKYAPERAEDSEVVLVSKRPDADEDKGVRTESIEAEVRNIEDTVEDETVKEDGTRVKKTTKTITHVQIVTDVTWRNGVKTGETEREELIGKDIYEEITEIAPGIDDLGAEDVRIETSVTNSEKTLADGTWEKRKTTRKIVQETDEKMLSQYEMVSELIESEKQPKRKTDEQLTIEREDLVAMELVSEQLKEAEVIFEHAEDITRNADVFPTERTSWEMNQTLVESMVHSESGWIDIGQHKSVIEVDNEGILTDDFIESKSFERVDISEHSVQKDIEQAMDTTNTKRTEQEDLGFEEFSEEYSVTESTKFAAHETVEEGSSDLGGKIARVDDIGAEADISVTSEERSFEEYSEEYSETTKTEFTIDNVATVKKTGLEGMSETTGLASNIEVIREVDNIEKSVAGFSGNEEEKLDTSMTSEWCVVEKETFDTEEHTTHSYEEITTIKQKKTRTVMIRSIGPDGEISENLETEEYESSNESESLSRRSSIDSTTETLATGELAVQKYDPELRNITVFTDTIEEDPVVDTEMMEYEDTLPDGTIVKRKVTKTKTKQSVVRRVVLEGLDDEPSFVDPSSQALVQVRPGVQQFTRYSDHHSTEPDVTTDIQVTEDKLPDGTVVRKRITNTKQQQLITERLVLGGTGLFDEEDGEDEVFESLKRLGSPKSVQEMQALRDRRSGSGTSVPIDRTPSSAASSSQKEMEEWEIVDKQ